MNVQPEFRFRDEISIRVGICNEPMFHYLGICVSTDIGSGDHLAFCLVGLTSCLGFGRSWVRVPLPTTSVITSNNNRVVVLSSNGTQLHSFTDGFIYVGGVAVDGAGNIYVTDVNNNRVVVLSSSGTQLHSFTDGFKSPTGVAVDGSGNIYVVDSNNNRVVVLSSSGTQLHSFTDGFSDPLGVAVDISGNIYVGDVNNNRIVVLSSNGTQLHSFADYYNQPTGVALDGFGNIYVADYGVFANRILVLAGIGTCAPSTSSSSASATSSPAKSASSSLTVLLSSSSLSSSSFVVNASTSVSTLNPAPFGGRRSARYTQQSLLSNAYQSSLYLAGGTTTLTDAIWQSSDGGVSWSPLGSSLTLAAIPTFMGADLALLANGVLAIYSGVLANGTATSTVATTSTLFATAPFVYTAPFTPRSNSAYTTIPQSNITMFCGGLNPSSLPTSDCWLSNRPELGVSSWIQQTSTGPFPSQLSNAALITLYDTNSTLLLCGGAVVSGTISTAINTCWVSLTLGVTWSVGITATWGARSGLVATSDLNGWAYVYGGQAAATSNYYYDLWLTTDRASTWTLVTFPTGQSVTIQDGCLSLYYTQQYYNGVFTTLPQFVFFAGYSPITNSSVLGSYFVPESVTSSNGSALTVIPPLPTFSISLDIVKSKCQFTFTAAGTLTGFGVSSTNPNSALNAGFIASLVGSILGIPASAVQVCVNIDYAYLSTERGEMYLYSPSTVNLTNIVHNITFSDEHDATVHPKRPRSAQCNRQWHPMRHVLFSTR